MSEENIKIVISGDTTAIEARLVALTKRFEELGGKAATDALSKMNSLESSIKKLDGTASSAHGVFGKLTQSISVGVLAASAAQKGFELLQQAGEALLKTIIDDEKRLVMLHNALKTINQDTPGVVKWVQDLGMSMERTGTQSHDLTEVLATDLLRAGASGVQTMQMLQVAADKAGGDANKYRETVEAFIGMIETKSPRGFKALGLEFDKTKTFAENLQGGLDTLSKRFQDVDKDMKGTVAGGLLALRNSWHSWMEELTQGNTGPLKNVISGLQFVVDHMDNIIGALKVGAIVGVTLWNALEVAADGVMLVINLFSDLAHMDWDQAKADFKDFTDSTEKNAMDVVNNVKNGWHEMLNGKPETFGPPAPVKLPKGEDQSSTADDDLALKQYDEYRKAEEAVAKLHNEVVKRIDDAKYAELLANYQTYGIDFLASQKALQDKINAETDPDKKKLLQDQLKGNEERYQNEQALNVKLIELAHKTDEELKQIPLVSLDAPAQYNAILAASKAEETRIRQEAANNNAAIDQASLESQVAYNEAAMSKSKETITAISMDLFDGLTSGGNIAANIGKNLMNTFKKMAEDQIKESIANIVKKKAIAQAENAIKKTEIQADTQKSASKTASTLPFPINLILAAATMAGLAYLTKGFDDPVNDAVALRSGKDYGRLFKQGAGQELGAPGFGELMNGKMVMRGGIAPAPQPSLTINFHGDVYEASAVTTIMNKIKEELYFGTNTLELNPLGITR